MSNLSHDTKTPDSENQISTVKKAENFAITRMRAIRLVHELSQAECAKKIGTRQSLVAKLELHEIKVTLGHLIMYAAGFSVPVDYFLERSEYTLTRKITVLLERHETLDKPSR